MRWETNTQSGAKVFHFPAGILCRASFCAIGAVVFACFLCVNQDVGNPTEPKEVVDNRNKQSKSISWDRKHSVNVTSRRKGG